MSQTTIKMTFNVAGVPTDVTSVCFRDPTDTYGLRRTDTLETLIDAGTAFVHDSTGAYTYTFTDPAAGLVYNYWVEYVFRGTTFRVEKERSQDSPELSISLGASPVSILNTTVTIQRQTRVQSRDGSQTPTWSDIATDEPARVSLRTGSVIDSSGKREAVLKGKIYLFRDPGNVKEDCRVVWTDSGGVTRYLIVEIFRDMGGAGRAFVIEGFVKTP